MMLKDVLSSRAKQRIILAWRAADQSRQQSREFILDELAILDDPKATGVEMCTGVASAIGQRAIELPVALVAGAEEFFRRR